MELPPSYRELLSAEMISSLVSNACAHRVRRALAVVVVGSLCSFLFDAPVSSRMVELGCGVADSLVIRLS